MALFEIQQQAKRGLRAAHTTPLLQEYAIAYWRAAGRLAEAGTKEGLDAYPAAFLYRHALETAMKAILVEHTPIHRNSTEAVLKRSHSLGKQLSDLHAVLESFGALEIDGYHFDSLRGVVQSWEKYDPDSFAFRYFLKKDGETPSSLEIESLSEEGDFRFNLAQFSEEMDAALEYLFASIRLIDEEIFKGIE
jgi:hypothetical protein